MFIIAHKSLLWGCRIPVVAIPCTWRFWICEHFLPRAFSINLNWCWIILWFYVSLENLSINLCVIQVNTAMFTIWTRKYSLVFVSQVIVICYLPCYVDLGDVVTTGGRLQSIRMIHYGKKTELAIVWWSRRRSNKYWWRWFRINPCRWPIPIPWRFRKLFFVSTGRDWLHDLDVQISRCRSASSRLTSRNWLTARLRKTKEFSTFGEKVEPIDFTIFFAFYLSLPFDFQLFDVASPLQSWWGAVTSRKSEKPSRLAVISESPFCRLVLLITYKRK